MSEKLSRASLVDGALEEMNPPMRDILPNTYDLLYESFTVSRQTPDGSEDEIRTRIIGQVLRPAPKNEEEK